MSANTRLVSLPLAATFGELPTPTGPLAPPRRAAAHVPIPFPDQAQLERERHERLAEERAIDREAAREAEIPSHRQQVEERTQIALRAASQDSHARGFNAGFWHGFKCGGWLGLVLGHGLGWLVCVITFKLFGIL
jgi:hypothetical protein